MKTNMDKFDAIIIGFGKAGKTLATEFAKREMEVAVIEQSDKMYGGTCINIGCIPTKTLVHQAKMASTNSNAGFDERAVFYRNAIKTKENVIEALRNKNYHLLADNPHIKVFHGKGSFMSDDTVCVTGTDGSTLLQSGNIIINTGSETVIPPIPGIGDNPYIHTSTSIMNLTSLPRQLIIIGGGYIGLEFASMYASFGSQVTVLESYPILIGREDRDIADCVKDTLEKKGVRFIMNAKVKSVDANTVIFDNSETGETVTLKSDAILLATGRRPFTDGLNLSAAGVETDERGAIKVDDRLITTNPHIRAVGDVKGGLQFTYISLDDFRIIRDDLFGEGQRTLSNRGPVAYSVFIDPPLARVGISEDEARSKDMDVIVKKLPVMAIPRAKTLGETEGMLKAIIDKDSRQILGCTLFAPDASEVINIVTAAMKAGMDSTFLRDFIFTHPSMSEALNDLFS
jgi:pyruvate/2-oxoglutarate dehydrogenase complex dihydrolipoamide dehydrogenase (E3) component